MGELAGVVRGDALRVGIVGAGFIGEVHAAAARRAGARVVGVAASTPASTEDAVVRLGAERAWRPEDLVTAADVDVVHVCTPNHLHVPLAATALAAGKHVVCEKPLATSGTDADHLTALASGAVATVPFVYRFYPMVREARARVAAAGFGPLRLVHGGYLQDWLSSAGDDNWRVDAETSGPSRAFADIGSHWCDVVEFVTGDRISAVCAELATVIGERSRRAVSTEDVAVVVFRTRGGVTGSVVISQVSAGHKNQLRFEITGAGATLAFDQERPETLWVGRRAGTELVARDPAHLHPSAAAYCMVPAGHPQGYQDCFDAFVADTYRAVAAGSVAAVDGLPTFADGARAAHITDAVLRSAVDHGWVKIAGAQTKETTS